MFLRPRMTRYGGHAGPYVWGGVTGVTDPDNPWLSAVQENTATRLVVSADSYDAEQRFLVNENPLSVRTALGVGFGTAGCAGPVFAPDKYGPAMGLNQRLGSASSVSAVLPTFTDGTKVTFELDFDVQPGELGTQFVLFFETGAIRIYTAGSSDRRLFYYDGSAASAVTSSLTSYGLTLGDRWKARVVIDGTSITGYASIDGGETWGANVTAVRASQNFSGKTVYVGSSNTTNGVRCKYYGVTVRDGDENAEVVAEFTPGLFVGGNRANGDTAVDEHGVTWTITRPAATTDMARVMVGRSEQYISLPGVAGEYVSTPDTAANSLTTEVLDVRVRCQPDDMTPASDSALVSKWVNTPQKSWRFDLRTTGVLRLSRSIDGTAWDSGSSSSVAAITGVVWLRATYNPIDGAIAFYYSAEQVATSDLVDGWTTLGTASVAPGSLFNSTSPIEVGSFDLGASSPLAASLFCVELWSDGTLVERIDAAEADPNSTTFTSSTSGATVTVNKSASAQYHATVVPPNTTIVQGDGINDFAEVIGDDTITSFVPATGLTVLLDAAFGSGAASGAVFASSANASTDDGIIISRNGANERIQGRVDDGTTVATVGDNADNITYDTRFQAAFAFGDSDHEAYVDGVSVETATDAVGSIAAAGPLRLGAEIDGSNKAAFDLYAFAVVGDDMSDSEVAATAAEGLAI